MAHLGVVIVEVPEEKQAGIRATRAAERESCGGAYRRLRVLERTPEAGYGVRVPQDGQHLCGSFPHASVWIAQPLCHPGARVR
jgi:hypothetical protein